MNIEQVPLHQAIGRRLPWRPDKIIQRVVVESDGTVRVTAEPEGFGRALQREIMEVRLSDLGVIDVLEEPDFITPSHGTDTEAWFYVGNMKFRLWTPHGSPPFPWDTVRLTVDP